MTSTTSAEITKLLKSHKLEDTWWAFDGETIWEKPQTLSEIAAICIQAKSGGLSIAHTSTPHNWIWYAVPYDSIETDPYEYFGVTPPKGHKKDKQDQAPQKSPPPESDAQEAEPPAKKKARATRSLKRKQTNPPPTPGAKPVGNYIQPKRPNWLLWGCVAGVVLAIVYAFSGDAQTTHIEQGIERADAPPPPDLSKYTGAIYAGQKPDQAITFAGEPKSIQYPNTIKTLDKGFFSIGYDEKTLLPAWVAYRVDRAKLSQPTTLPPFESDPKIQTHIPDNYFSQAYLNGRYDRARLVPFYDMISRHDPITAQTTMYYSNIVPQKPALYRGAWSHLERMVAYPGGYANIYGSVWVIAGPIFGEDRAQLPGSAIRIPEAFYKIIIREKNGKPECLAFLFNQDTHGSIRNFAPNLITIDELETKTGFDFNPLLADTLEDQIESTRPSEPWQTQM